MTEPDDALARAEVNFAAAKELCRTGHEVCTYGGMSSAGGYWLADEDCPLNHGETCDLRAVCDGAEATTGFRGSEPDPDIAYWVWRVTACQPCAEVYVAAHPEWKREDPDAPKPSYDEVMARLHEQVEADRAAMSPAQREYSDMVTNMLLYGQHPAPDPAPEPQFTGFAGLFGDAIALEPVVKPQRDRPPEPTQAVGGSLSADAIDRAMRELWDSKLYAPPHLATPTRGTSTGLFDALGGIRPGHGGMDRVLDWALRTDEAANGPLGRAKWAPKDCICPWPWPTADGHVRLDCPRYTAPTTRPHGRNTRTGCQRYESGTWVHGDPHDCPPYVRGR